ncbi:MAG: acyltransferase [Sphingobacteriales bacterium]|nr:MAG: acyltransferase [Sphingobacteriales bacterium]TAF82308.1 MAG: acyltransferase [Sphingobacteriales bacterium]
MRIQQLTFTRFIASISIVFYHYGINIFPFNFEFFNTIIKKANIGVSFFFILSGFVMIVAYNSKIDINFADFIKRRLARIYPIYAFSIILLLFYFIIIQLFFKTEASEIDFKGLILNTFLIQSWYPKYALSFNTPGWSLSVEMFFYTSFPLLYTYLYKRYSLKIITFSIILIYIISQVLLHILLFSNFNHINSIDRHNLLFYFPLMHFNEFLIGNLTGMIFINLKNFKNKNYDLLIIGLLILLIILLKITTVVNFHNGMLAIIFVPLILFISGNNGVLTKLFSLKPLVFLGEISFGMYILQKPLFFWANGVFKYFNITNVTFIFYIYLISLISFSALSYTYLETPVRKLINKIKL